MLAETSADGQYSGNVAFIYPSKRWLRFAGGILLAGVLLVASYTYFSRPIVSLPFGTPPVAGNIHDQAWETDVFATAASSPETRPNDTPHVANNAIQDQPSTTTLSTATSTEEHIIQSLVDEASEAFEYLLSEQTQDLNEAVESYRGRRGRLPPPGFDRWFNYASQRGCILLEQFFDPIYESLDPLWTLSPHDLRGFASQWPFVISIRNGTTHRWEDEFAVIHDPMSVWERALNRLPLADLPDIDLAFNTFDEPMVFVKWEFRQRAKQLPKHIPQDPTQVVSDYATLPRIQSETKTSHFTFAWDDIPGNVSLWEIARQACDPTTPGSKASVPTDYSTPPEFPDPNTLSYMRKGFIADWASSKSACTNPEFRNLHGTFVGMQRNGGLWGSEWAVTTHPIPLLGSCRIRDITGEIPIPGAAMMEPQNSEFGGSEAALHLPWSEKRDQLYWRGVASGGVSTADTWTRFQRHRLVSMLNGTQVDETLALTRGGASVQKQTSGEDLPLPFNFPVPPTGKDSPYDFDDIHGTSSAEKFRNWLLSISDAALTHIRCYPPVTWFATNGRECEYSGPFYDVSENMPHDDMFQYKYLIDVDGASWSSRFRSQLASSSVVLKATIFDEWHDSRLVPWKHFVPIDVTNIDLYAILQFFLGFQEDKGNHDEMAKHIADDSSQWTRSVLRRDDMDVYLYRIVLELARLSDERRDMMGFVKGT